MGNQLLALRDYQTRETQYLDEQSGTIYADAEGLRRLHQMTPIEYVLVGEHTPLRLDGKMVHTSSLANCAAEHMYSQMAALCGKAPDIARLDPRGRPMTDKDGRLVTMDLAPSDVHTAAALPNYAAGYHIGEGIADAASPVILAPRQSDVYYTSNSDNDFKRKLPVAGAPGAGAGEVNPAYTAATYQAVQYILGGFLPTEVMANADTPLKPLQKLTQMVVDAHRLEREIRVSTLLQTSANWNANLVTAIAAASKWNGGASADPVANLHAAIEASFMPITGIVWSEQVEHDFVRNAAVQKFFTYKDRVDGLPDPSKLSSVLRLPPIYTGTMKYSVGGAATYVWGNHVVLLHQPAEMPPTTQLEVATTQTFRWTGGSAPDGTMTGGMLVRTYWDPKRGGNGGTQVVVTMYDAEAMTSALVGGLLLNAHA